MASQGRSAVYLLALGNAGGVVAYAPLLTLLLPARISVLAGSSDVRWLAFATLVGAVCASLGNILFGWASDRVGTRRSWAAAGLVSTLLCYALLAGAASLVEVVAAVGAYQLCLNMMLAPVAAWAAEAVPDEQKGLLGGWLSAGPLLGALSGILVTLPQLPGLGARLALTALLIVILMAPLLLKGQARVARSAAPPQGAALATSPSDLLLLWLSRLLVQVAGSALFGFLLYYFFSLAERPSDATVARLATLALLVAVPVSLLCGRLSDLRQRRRPFLVGAAVVAAAGLAIMATAGSLMLAAAGYVLFQSAISVFLALHSGLALLMLPSPDRYGRDLGLLNLTNTLPAMIAPALAAWLVPVHGFGPFLALLAAMVGASALLIWRIRDEVA